jgi:hypothetical protein
VKAHYRRASELEEEGELDPALHIAHDGYPTDGIDVHRLALSPHQVIVEVAGFFDQIWYPFNGGVVNGVRFRVMDLCTGTVAARRLPSPHLRCTRGAPRRRQPTTTAGRSAPPAGEELVRQYGFFPPHYEPSGDQQRTAAQWADHKRWRDPFDDPGEEEDEEEEMDQAQYRRLIRDRHGTGFCYRAPPGWCVSFLHGRRGWYQDALGVYFSPIHPSKLQGRAAQELQARWAGGGRRGGWGGCVRTWRTRPVKGIAAAAAAAAAAQA